MATRYLIDSVILIDHLNGVAAATRWLGRLGAREAVISAITRAEVRAGATPDEEEVVSTLLDSFECVGLDAETADAAAEFRRKHRLKLPDAFQAALAVSRGLLLVTRNTKDFSPSSFSFVRVPYRV